MADLGAGVVVIDTNVFVAAGFNRTSASHEILARVASGEIRLAWSDATRSETENVLRRIPPLNERELLTLFRNENRHVAAPSARHGFVTDQSDRKFLALAEAVGVPLVTNDSDLLEPRDQAAVPVLTPREYLAGLGAPPPP